MTPANNAEQAEGFDTVFTRLIDAPRPLVYRAFTDPKMLALWFGPRGFDVPECETDLRPGGRMLIVMRGPDGTRFPIDGTYHAVSENRLISYTNGLEGHPQAWHDMVNEMRGTPKGTPVTPPVTTIEFADKADGTLVTITTSFLTVADRDAFTKMQMRAGWSHSLDKLAELASTDFSGKDHREIVITRFIAAPVALVWKAWSDVDAISAWWGPEGFTDTPIKFDFRIGGEWLHTMHGPDGTDYPNRAVFTDIVEHERIAYDLGTGEPGDTNIFHTTVSFRAVEGGTEVTLHTVFDTAAQRAHVAGFGAIELGYQTLGKLDAFVMSA
ncbi:SRPBCC domain-containing protein [Rhizobium sp. PAMB 3174]